MDVKKLLFQYFDKAILLIMLALCAFGAWERFVLPPPSKVEQVKVDIGTFARKVDDNLKTSRPPVPPELAYTAEVEKFYNLPPTHAPEIRWPLFQIRRDIVQELTVMNRMPWDFNVRAGIDFSTVTCDKGYVDVTPGKDRGIVILPRREGETIIRFADTEKFYHILSVKITRYIPDPQVFEPQLVSAAQIDGAAILQWKRNEEYDQRSPTSEFRVYRRKADEGPDKDKLVHTQPVPPPKPGQPPSDKAYKFVDKDVEFDAQYVYSIAAYSAKAKPPESKKAVTGKAVVVPSDTVFFVGMGLAGGTAQLKLYKWTAENRWQGPRTFFGKPGDVIQKVDPYTKVDYDTGCILVAANEIMIKRLAFNRIMEMKGVRVVYADRHGVLRMKLSSEDVRNSPVWQRFNEEDAEPQRAGKRARKVEKKKPEDELMPGEEELAPEDEDILVPEEVK